MRWVTILFELGINKATSAPFRNFGNDRQYAGFPRGSRRRDDQPDAQPERFFQAKANLKKHKCCLSN